MTLATITADRKTPKPRHIVLLTGFGPFPGTPQNQSSTFLPSVLEACRASVPEADIHTAIIPTHWEHAPRHLDRLVEDAQPNVILHFGVARDTRGFRIERSATNTCRSAPDVDGHLPATLTLTSVGPERCPATIPIAAIEAALKTLNICVEVSDDAGSYLCNAVLYHSLTRSQPDGILPMTGFIHIPAELSQADLSRDELVRGTVAIVNTCLENSR